MSTPSMMSAIKKLRVLLTRKEKMKWLSIAVFAFFISLLEVGTASIIVVFAQVLTQPNVGRKYLEKIGFANNLTQSQIIFYIAITVGIVYLIKNFISGIEIFAQNISVQKMNHEFKSKLLNRYAEADYGFYLTRNSSVGWQVISVDVEHMFTNGMASIAGMLSEGIVFFSLIFMIIYINPSLALTVFLIGGGVFVIVAKYLLPRFYKFGQKLQQAGNHTTQHLTQFFHAFKEIILLGKKEFFVDAYCTHSHTKTSTQAIQTSMSGLPRMVIEVLFIGIFVLTIIFLCRNNESTVQIMGVLGGYLYVGFRLMPGLNRMITHLTAFKGSIPAIERVYHEYEVVAEKQNYVDVPGFSFNEGIVVKNLSFKYLNTNKNALTDISLNIKKGECLGVVGETGSGKSTLIDLILGVLKPSEGSILVDNKHPVSAYQWHQKIGYVPQSLYLLDDTIEKNIAFGEKKIDMDRLNEVIEAAQLSKLMRKLPDGVKTFVGERGVRLSGGERQRIVIARAIYHNPEVLIFDEATSALDTETETILMKTIQTVCKNRTVIMIAHRLATLENCDRIIKLENGYLI